MLSDGKQLLEIEKEWTETIELGSHQFNKIKVFYRYRDAELKGLIFYTGKHEISTIGNTNINQYTNTTTITNAKDEVWCGVGTSSDESGEMRHFQLITAKLN